MNHKNSMKEAGPKTRLSDRNQNVIDAYDYLGNSCSATDCTGLMPSYPQSRAELEAYEELYHYCPSPSPAPASPSSAGSPSVSPETPAT